VSWIVRPYDAATDEAFVLHSWVTSYMRGRAGRALRACGAKRSAEGERMFWRDHRAIVLGLLSRASTVVACDAERASHTDSGEPVFFGFATCEGDLVHYAFVKRSASAVGLGRDLARDLLGDRLDRACGYTFEQVDLRRLGMLPSSWYFDVRGLCVSS
jgi:hypothetical protein